MRKLLRRTAAVLISAIMLFSMFLPALGVANVTKDEKSYEIAVVFDNSGSMYQDKAWSRAKYAMEIFASMLNYSNGDKLWIFPMWEVTTDGSTPAFNNGGSYDKIEIKSKEDIDKISNMFTVTPDATPYKPVTNAYNYLANSSQADVKWLIVLTDGEFNQEEQGLNQPKANINSAELQKRLTALANNSNINVQYLGFGKATALSPNESSGFFAKKSSDTSLMNDLIYICNKIFQRSILPVSSLNGSSLKVDLSMKNLIVFVQGPNARINSLTDSNGNSIAVTLDSGQRKYSEVRANDNGRDKYSAAPVDTSLAGQVVTFDACPKGQYTLNYSDATNIQIFYEPDVDIKLTLTDENNQPVDFSSGVIIAGDYTVNYSLIDRVTGENAMTSGLLGSDVKLDAYLKQSDDADPVPVKNGELIHLDADDSTELYVTGSYLGSYTIDTKETGSIPFPLKVVLPEQQAFAVNAQVLQSQSWYKLSKRDEWEPIKVTLALNGQPLTAEQFAATELAVEIENGLSYRCEPAAEESAYYIHICQNDNGQFVDPETGKYNFKVTGSFTDEHERKLTAADDGDFEIQRYDKFWRWLFWILLLLILLIIIWLILNHPVLPKVIYMNIPKARTTNKVRANGTKINLSTDLYPGELRCEAKACTPLRNSGKRSAKFKIKSISAIGSVTWYEIDGMRFKKGNNGKYVNDDGETVDQMKPMLTVGDETEFKWYTNSHGSATARMYINHND